MRLRVVWKVGSELPLGNDARAEMAVALTTSPFAPTTAAISFHGRTLEQIPRVCLGRENRSQSIVGSGGLCHGYGLCMLVPVLLLFW